MNFKRSAHGFIASKTGSKCVDKVFPRVKVDDRWDSVTVTLQKWICTYLCTFYKHLMMRLYIIITVPINVASKQLSKTL